ncbi:MAG TPA: hypothetical protein IAB39_04205 [Candidatus Onthovicinus excrementipullorum]|nr:hypothetical protein [Candidatus Onthovicinus excrementipullorum]
MKNFLRRHLKISKYEQHVKLGIFLVASVLILLFSIFAPPGVSLFDKVGMELALIAIGVFLLRFPTGIFLSANLFVVAAAAGSVLRFYDLFPGYDRVVHFLSGIILGFVGFYTAKWLLGRLSIAQNPLLLTLFSFFFSCSCAGFWEIIEFTTDCVSQMGVQHGNTDTMGDIVAGFIGAACFGAVCLYKYRRNLADFIRDLLHLEPKHPPQENQAEAAVRDSAEQRGQ